MKKKKMHVIGLTGGIGMGKSTVAGLLGKFGIPVHHADEAVHALLRPRGKAVQLVAKAFPGTLKGGGVDRKSLGEVAFSDRKKLFKLESILHPLVRECQRRFLREARKEGAEAVVLEVPLLFETGAEVLCDAVICVTASKAVQKARVMQRRGMTEAKLKSIMRRQMPDRRRRERSDFVIETGGSIEETKKRLRHVLMKIME